MWRKIVPLLILILPLLFLFLGMSYHDSFYFIIAGVTFVFSIFIIVPKLLPKKSIHLKLPGFKSKRVNVDRWREEIVEQKLFQYPKNQHLVLFLVKSPFPLLLIGYVLLFTYLSVFILPFTESKNILIGYYGAYWEFIKKGGLSLLIPLILITVVAYLMKNVTKKHFSLRSYPKQKIWLLLSIIIILFVSFNLSIASTFLFGIGEANLLASKIKSNPESAEIIWGKDKILQRLKKMDHPPSIIDGGDDFNIKVILTESISNNTRSSYYRKYVIKNIPNSLLIPVGIPHDPLVMFKDNLVINSLDKDQMQAISPTLAKLLVKKYFNNRFIKDEPTSFEVLGRQDYLKFREDQINEQLAEIEQLIDGFTTLINNIYGSISNDKAKIAYNQNGLNSSISQKDSAYNYCLTAGYTSLYFGTFYHYYTQQECDSQKTQWDQTIAGFQKNISDWQAQLQYDQSQLPQYQEAKDTLTAYNTIIASQKDSTPQELGLFLPADKTIKLALDYTGSKSAVEYLVTLTHEYLHYTSYVSEERSLPHFFEEGLTETYARRVIKNELGIDTNIGYPLLVKIIQQMITKIPEDKLQEIYFTKDKNELQSLLDEAYGKDFYKNSEYYFSIMSYVPPKEALKFANNIMIKIGGKPLTEEDLVSSLPKVN